LTVFGLALVIGIVKCWSISRRPLTNRKCVMALVWVQAGWLFPIVCLALSLFVPVPLTRGLIYLISIALIAAAAVLAIAGLRECSRERSRYAHGKAHAISALVTSSLVLMLPLAVFVEMKWNVLGTLNPPAGARVLVFDDLNFKFFAPGGRWKLEETNGPSPKATLTLSCSRPQAIFFVLAERAPRQNYSNDELTEAVLKNLRDTADTVRVLYRGPVRLDRLEGQRLHSEVGSSAKKLYYEHRLFATNGWAYQLVARGRQRDQSSVAEEAVELARHFELLDYTRRP
jgi:hypothetical protein